MKIAKTITAESPRATGYTMWLSADETYLWATRPEAKWPCSEIGGKRIMVRADSNGLCDFTMNGKSGADVSGDELVAIVADHLPADLRLLWPCWEK